MQPEFVADVAAARIAWRMRAALLRRRGPAGHGRHPAPGWRPCSQLTTCGGNQAAVMVAAGPACAQSCPRPLNAHIRSTLDNKVEAC